MSDAPIRFEVVGPGARGPTAAEPSLPPGTHWHWHAGGGKFEQLPQSPGAGALCHRQHVDCPRTAAACRHASAGPGPPGCSPISWGGLRGLGQPLAQRIYGLGRTAATWVDGLAGVTGRRDLRFLTLLTWRHVLPDRHLFSRLLRWCPACVEAWRTTGHPLYDPLLWKLNPITACVRHQRRLRSHCHACQQRLTTFSGRSRPGYCSRCGYWLGTADRADLQPDERLSEDAWPWQHWVITNLGQLLQVAPRLACPPPAETVARAITAYQAHRTAAGQPSSVTRWGRNATALADGHGGGQDAAHPVAQVLLSPGDLPGPVPDGAAAGAPQPPLRWPHPHR